MKLPATEDAFMELYGTPFRIDGVYADDIQSLGKLYRSQMLSCTTLEELEFVIGKFGWLATDASQVVETMTEEDFTMFVLTQAQNVKISMEEGTLAKFAPIHLPTIMLHAYLVAEKYQVPEYYAAIQWVRARVYMPSQSPIQ